MIATSIHHGDLHIDFDAAGWVQITRQSTGHAIQLSVSEWVFLLKCVEIRGWPIAQPTVVQASYLAQDSEDVAK